MKKLLVLIVIAALAPVAVAKVWTTVYRCDETTPLAPVDPNHPTVYRDIMVGTRLVIVVSSGAKGTWTGALLSSWDDWGYGDLVGRSYNDKSRSYDGSCIAAAGVGSSTRFYQDTNRIGLQFYARATGVPGDWFIIDYHAKQVGPCDIGLYDFLANFDVPFEKLHFTHIPSRDFNHDDIVDFKDLALLASHWHSMVDPNSPGAVVDLNIDAHIDTADLALFSEYWLDQPDCHKPSADPNDPSSSL